MASKKNKNSKRHSKKRGTASGPTLRSRLKTYWRNQSVSLRFLGVFALMIGAFYAFYYSDFNLTHIHPHLLNGQANIGAFLLGIMGQPVTAIGETISGDTFRMSVSGGCDGLEVTALLVAGILAFPSSWPEKGRGLLYGVGVLTILNILRLPMLYFAGAKGSQALFELLHVQGGFVIFISITMLIWGYWVIKVLNQRRAMVNGE